jgi:purine-binding chemotaxis protein CheW
MGRANAKEIGDARRVLTFRSGTETLVLAAEDVAEVVRPPPMARVPQAPASVCGVANLRGTVLPILSLAALLGEAQEAATAASRVVVLQRAAPSGLLVDAVAALTTPGALRAAGTPFRAIDLDRLLKAALVTARPRRTDRSTGRAEPEVEAAVRTGRTLVSFDVAGQTYALPLDQTREVLAMPPDLVPQPPNEDAAVGVIFWRDRLLPLVSARALLGRPQDGFEVRQARIVVVHADTGMVGLVTDGMREILHVPDDAVDAVPALLGRSHGRANIEAIARLDGGKRLVSILAPGKFLGDRDGADMQQQDDGMTSANGASAEATEQFVIFTVGTESYGLAIAVVEEIVRLPEMLTRLPRAPDFVAGVMNLRGQVLPVIDQARRFGVMQGSQDRRRRVLVIRMDDMQVGFVVDAVSEIIAVSAGQVAAAPDFAQDGSRIFDRVAQRGGGAIVLLIDPAALLDRTERDLVSALKRDAAAGGV